MYREVLDRRTELEVELMQKKMNGESFFCQSILDVSRKGHHHGNH